jgi:hypothetical protein
MVRARLGGGLAPMLETAVGTLDKVLHWLDLQAVQLIPRGTLAASTVKSHITPEQLLDALTPDPVTPAAVTTDPVTTGATGGARAADDKAYGRDIRQAYEKAIERNEKLYVDGLRTPDRANKGKLIDPDEFTIQLEWIREMIGEALRQVLPDDLPVLVPHYPEEPGEGEEGLGEPVAPAGSVLVLDLWKAKDKEHKSLSPGEQHALARWTLATRYPYRDDDVVKTMAGYGAVLSYKKDEQGNLLDPKTRILEEEIDKLLGPATNPDEEMVSRVLRIIRGGGGFHRRGRKAIYISPFLARDPEAEQRRRWWRVFVVIHEMMHQVTYSDFSEWVSRKFPDGTHARNALDEGVPTLQHFVVISLIEHKYQTAYEQRFSDPRALRELRERVEGRRLSSERDALSPGRGLGRAAQSLV